MAASTNPQMGGTFDPGKDVNFTGAVDFATAPTAGSATFATTTGTQTLTNKTLNAVTISGATISGTVTVATGAAMINPSITGAAITGTVTVASGATITTPTMLSTAATVTATGATGGAGAVLTAITPQAVVINAGATGSGVDIPTGAAVAGAQYEFYNQVAATMRIYAVGGTINGTTGTTAFTITNTGNKYARFICTAAGVWFAGGNT